MFPGRGELQGTTGNERNYQVATILSFRQGGSISNGSQDREETEDLEEAEDRKETVPGSPQV